MEIERKFLLKEIPENLDTCPYCLIEQGYLCTSPVVRIRRLYDLQRKRHDEQRRI